MFARRGGGGAAELAVLMLSAGLGYTLADGLDRFLATYNPSATERPKDKFTSDGTGMLANSLNVASMPGLIRAGAAVGAVALPTTAALMMRDSLMRKAAEGMAIGAGVSAVKALVNNVVMPLLIGKDTSPTAMQKSFIARLYPAEVAASINMKAKQTAVSSAGSGALSGPAGDVGPFALSGDSPYETADQALRRQAGVSGDSPYPSAEQALRAGVSGDSPYASASEAIRREAGVSAWEPGPPTTPGPGPQPAADCGCVGDEHPYYGLAGAPEEQDQLYTTQ